MKIANIIVLIVVFALYYQQSYAQQPGKTDAIYSGLPWYDQYGKVVSAHGANIIQEKNLFYLFGEAHTDTSNAFVGFNCYSSKDLYNWKFEKIALPVQSSGKLGPNRIGERPKVMKNSKTGEFIMYMHVDTLGYKDQFVGYAVSKNITGPYQFQGALLFNGKPIKKWDMGTFQDDDGKGYLLTHGGVIHQLSDDYKSIVAETNKQIASGFESPALFRKGNTYYFIGSHLTSWEKNDNYYYTSTSLSGPWIARGLIAPKDQLTWNSQSTFVLKIAGSKDTTYLFMGDRWSYPRQLSAATYVWQPIKFYGDSISLPSYLDAWNIDLKTGLTVEKNSIYQTIEHDDKRIQYIGDWARSVVEALPVSRSKAENASCSFTFSGTQIGLQTVVLPDNGYANIILTDKNGKVVVKNLIDMYSKVPAARIVFLSPVLPKAKYKLTISTAGERPNWTDKKKISYGSTANNITISKLMIKE
ncbi:family 43 glycosylhydrolase [Pedobacter sp. CFBP9032]|uniref:family 43 glycosylhydrolase n=1 Tax=Pedobacter sp. CFBP9032 TaxID=3096539 RepID=UPI002A6A32F2|nr:family 43 glycosylhydrolase [Pedobacter sp. CFBP9032]MDY0907061.1 family 43 glycosylhydrolase [Pedobacter sp. CFBP9032]